MKRKSLIAFAMLMATVMLIATGCGCQQESTEGDQKASKTEANTFSAKTEETKNSKDAVQKSSTDFSPGKSLAERQAVNYEDYMNGKNFDLTAYAEALGYTRLESPEDEGIVMYAIERDGDKYFFAFLSGTPYIFIDKKDGFVYKTVPNSTVVNPDDVIIVSKGQENQGTSTESLRHITAPMFHLSTADPITVDYLPGFTVIAKRDGSAQYYENGLIKYKAIGKVVESIPCNGLNF